MKIFIFLFLILSFTLQDGLKNIEDVTYDPLFTVVKKNKKKLKNKPVLKNKDKKDEKFKRP